MNKAFTKEDEASLTDEAVAPEEAQPLKGSGARYITPEGFKRLQEELQHIWKVERPKVTAEVSAAAAQGDRSENAEYIYGKKKLRELDRRIRYLSKRLDSLTVVEQKDEADRVLFGAWVTIEDEDGQASTYRIVGPDEFDVKLGKISVDSPVAKALLGKKEGDEVTIQRPKGPTDVVVASISYRQPGKRN
ncbi:MAG TPA: transcription elongation factor GreB [Myxococcales bacterium]|jgi:transcription elongation factor GreB